jgi:hypothetical protein
LSLTWPDQQKTPQLSSLRAFAKLALLIYNLIKAKSSKFLSPQQATEYFGISSFGPDFAEHYSQQADGV